MITSEYSFAMEADTALNAQTAGMEAVQDSEPEATKIKIDVDKGVR